MIIATNLIPRGFQAFALWPFIFVVPKRRNDIGLIEHEMVHYREQAWLVLWWVLKYFVSKKFRLEAEVRAYRRQIEVGGISRPEAAAALLLYHLGITYTEAFDALA